MTQHEPDGRTAKRGNVHMTAQARSASGLRDEGWLEDISEVGCCLVSRALAFRIGHRIIIRPQGMEGVTGVVRWATANKAGIEFDAPLYGPIVEHLWHRYKANEAVSFSMI